MKKINHFIIITTLIIQFFWVFIFNSCKVSQYYTKKQLKEQTPFENLVNTSYQLITIKNNGILKNNCSNVIKFLPEGILQYSFRDHIFNGVYLIENDSFKYISCGFNSKVFWSSEKECEVTPTKLALNLNGPEGNFQLNGDTLIITKLLSELVFVRQ